MKSINSKILVSGLALSLLSVSSIYADDSNTYINGSIGIQGFDNDRQIKDAGVISLGLERQFSKKWGAEIFYMDSSPDGKNGSGDIDLTQYGIDGLYYFDTDDSESKKLQPYAAAGIGHAEFDGNQATDDETQLRGGLGLRYLLNEHWALKADARLIYSEEANALDHLYSVGLSYAFKPQRKKAAVVATAPVVAADGDNDGVIDANDNCPSTPAGVLVDSNGCALDSDGDGVANYKDNCQGTVANAPVDAAGCALDSDNDGVADYQDNCPATPAGRQVDESGCKYVLNKTEEVTLKINFASNSNVVTDYHFIEIKKVALFMKKYSDVNTVIEGHTDDRGADNYNTALSQGRAEAVRDILINRYGIAANRVSALGYGESRPIASNDTKKGRLANRRVVAVMEAKISE